ncbi:glycoside hydrolase family 15 protein [Pontibacter locisalis]|uniref:Glycoside hydrolase family 15 protein n=1 Tax=Pontibacter locisalis TaxID=1719035 RepID=A0ABW5IQU5_9BACT
MAVVMEPKISDYVLIGNSRAAALLSNKGSIDWCCLPEFDSPSIFAALLDRVKGGCFALSPESPYTSSQNYLPDTNVVETVFENDDGRVRLTDTFTAMEEREKEKTLFPDHEILRVIEGITGTVRMKMEYTPRPYYGKNTPKLNDLKKLGLSFSWKENTYVLISTLDPTQITLNKDKSKATAEFQVQPGEQVIFSFSNSSQNPAIIPELRLTTPKRLQGTVSFWHKWIASCHYSGVYKDQVKRSALVLKLLTHAPSGAIVAAPTTSLPEEIGGVRNWDYRYCWLRDASFTIRALLNLGFEEEARAYVSWMLHATQLTRPKLQVVYSVFGHSSLEEKQLDWLDGYQNSKPVRVGNGADSQLQLDVYGEVLDGVYAYYSSGNNLDRETRKFLIGLGGILCKIWDQPDNGIWEVRSDIVHHTHSKVLAWVGLDRLIKLSEKHNWKDVPREKFKDIASRIKEAVEKDGYNSILNSYTREFNGNSLDASLLTLPLVGYCKASSPRMMSTVSLILEKLTKNNMVYRYLNTNDGLNGSEGTFGVCSFWLVENLVACGKLEEAVKVFETMIDHASPAGLLSEEVDPDTNQLLGNYPQGFSHIGLINAALTINKALEKGDKNHEH